MLNLDHLMVVIALNQNHLDEATTPILQDEIRDLRKAGIIDELELKLTVKGQTLIEDLNRINTVYGKLD